MKSAYLRSMNAEEFCQCLEDHGLYSMAVDTMVTMLEKQGRNQNEAHHGIQTTLELREGVRYVPDPETDNPFLPEGYKRQLEEKGWYKTPDAIIITSEMLIEELNNPTYPLNADSLDDPHSGTGIVDGNVDLKSSGSSGVSHQVLGRTERCQEEHPNFNPAPMPEGGIDQIIAEYNNSCNTEGFES